MPRNKRHIDRKEKKDEILKTAARLFREQGYTSTSMSQLAGAAGVAANTVYWYFSNKDDVLIAVLNNALEHGMQSLSICQTAPLLERAMKLLDLLEEYGALVTTVHSLLQTSEPVREWHDRFHRIVQAIITSELVARGTGREDAHKDALLLTYVFEGLLAHPQSKEDRQLTLEQAIYRLGVN